jgi:predicted DNA-binding transcriptional regulator AlpA
MPTHTNAGDLAQLTAEATTYLNAAQVRSRYGGVSDMALWRWLQDEDLGFPKPFRINRRRFWKASDLTAWERTRRSPVDEAA